MIFIRDEKVFSVSKTMENIPVDNVSLLFSEFFAYLLITGFYMEGKSSNGLIGDVPNLTEADHKSDFYFFNSNNEQLGKIYFTELTTRLKVLLSHPDVLDYEKKMLRQFDGIFRNDNTSYGYQLSARDILGVAYRRTFTNDMMNIAHYVAVTFGQTDFPEPKKLPGLYLSLFGNIHLADHASIIVSKPRLLYGTKVDGETVTATWSYISSLIDGFSDTFYSGYALGETLTGLNFLSSVPLNTDTISYPRYACALNVDSQLKMDKSISIPLVTDAYKEFMYGTVYYSDKLKLSRTKLLRNILDLMMEKAEASSKYELFSDNSNYKKLATVDDIRVNTLKTPVVLEYAIESLDSGLEALSKEEDNFDVDKKPKKGKKKKDKDLTQADDDTDESGFTGQDPVNKDDSDMNTDTDTTEEDPVVEDPQTDNNGYDPGNPTPSSPNTSPTLEKNNIDLISLDKNGEGINEDMYRQAVIALNDRLRRDDDIDIEANTKESLNQWVNSYLYRTAISATKDQISSLGLQQYLKFFK